MAGGVAREFLAAVVRQAKRQGLVSRGHFSVDRTMAEAWASQKSFQAKQGPEEGTGSGNGRRNPEVDFRGQRRRNETHGSKTGPEARLQSKSRTGEAKRRDRGHALTENRHGLIGSVRVRQTRRAGRARGGDGDGTGDSGQDEAGDARDGQGL